VAVGDELSHHDFCVNKILWAAETYKSDFQGVRLKDSIYPGSIGRRQRDL
jgi:hypothetical protein